MTTRVIIKNENQITWYGDVAGTVKGNPNVVVVSGHQPPHILQPGESAEFHVWQNSSLEIFEQSDR